MDCTGRNNSTVGAHARGVCEARRTIVREMSIGRKFLLSLSLSSLSLEYVHGWGCVLFIKAVVAEQCGLSFSPGGSVENSEVEGMEQGFWWFVRL